MPSKKGCKQEKNEKEKKKKKRKKSRAKWQRIVNQSSMFGS